MMYKSYTFKVEQEPLRPNRGSKLSKNNAFVHFLDNHKMQSACCTHQKSLEFLGFLQFFGLASRLLQKRKFRDESIAAGGAT